MFSPQVLRRFLLIFLPASLLPGCVVLALYYQDLAKEQTLYEQAGAHIVDLHADIITRELKSVESDLLYLADQAVLRDFLSGAAAGKTTLQEEYVLFCKRRAVYDQIRYLDSAGQEVIRINYNSGRPSIVAEGELQSKAARYYFVQTMLLDRGEVFVSPFDLNVEHETIERPLKPVIRFATPVFDKQGAKRGVLILNYLGAALIRKLIEVSINFPGSDWLLNQQGYFLHGPKPEDEWGFMFGNERTFATDFPEEWPSLSAEEGQWLTQHGLFTCRTLSPRRPVPAHRQARSEGSLTDPDAGDPSLKVVSYIPLDVIQGRASQLLRRILLLYGVVVVLVLVLAWYLAYAGAQRRNQELHLAESEARLRLLSSRLITAQEDERRSLSRDLHDELGQLVTAVTLDLQRASQAGDAGKKNELIGRALTGAACLLDHIHEISTRVRPTILDDLGLKDAVQSYLSEFEARTGIMVRSDLQFAHQAIPPVVSENIYRILQEALTNVAKHAHATEVVVGLEVAAQAIVLTVRDSGQGFAPLALDGKRLGLLGMRERAELLDGTFSTRSELGNGTEVRVSLPLPKNGHQPSVEN